MRTVRSTFNNPSRRVCRAGAVAAISAATLALLGTAAAQGHPPAPHGRDTLDRLVARDFAPQVTLNSPTPAQYSYWSIGELPEIWFDGTANDPQDGAVPGTRMRWTAEADDGDVVQVCRGSSWPASSSGGFGVYRDCSEFSARELDDGWWTVKLEAADSHGNIRSDSVRVRVQYVAR